MDLLGVMRACLRRWYVFLPVLGLTVWFCLQQYRAAAPQYTSTAAFAVVPSSDLLIARGQQNSGDALITNPYNGGTAQATLAALLTAALNTASVRDELLPRGGVAVTAQRNPEVDPTLVSVSLVSEDPRAAADAVAALQAGTNGVLAGLQTSVGAPPSQLFAAVPGGPVDPPLEDYPDRVRAVVAFGLAGTLLAVVLSVLAQSSMRGRRRHEDRRAGPLQQEPGTSPQRADHGRVAGTTATRTRVPARAALGRRRGASRREPIDVSDSALVRHR